MSSTRVRLPGFYSRESIQSYECVTVTSLYSCPESTVVQTIHKVTSQTFASLQVLRLTRRDQESENCNFYK